MKHTFRILILLIFLLVSACAPVMPDEDSTSNEQSVSKRHTLKITATSDGWDAPETASAGWTEITLENQSDGMRQTAFFRLDDDKTMDDVYAAIDAGMKGAPPWMTAYGGVSGLMPGETRTVTANLPAGQYIVIDPVEDAEGVPGTAKGYFMPLLVEQSDAKTEAPAGDISVELVDYAFVFDQTAIKSGKQMLHVTNSGPEEAHEIVLIKLDDGASVQDFLAAMAPDGPPGPPPGQIIAGTAPFDSSTENYLEVEFVEGSTYAMLCFLPSSQNEGQTHFMLGMIHQFQVSN